MENSEFKGNHALDAFLESIRKLIFLKSMEQFNKQNTFKAIQIGKTYKIAPGVPYVSGQEITISSVFNSELQRVHQSDPYSIILGMKPKGFDRLLYLSKCFAARTDNRDLRIDSSKDNQLLIGYIGTLEFIVHESELLIPNQ